MVPLRNMWTKYVKSLIASMYALAVDYHNENITAMEKCNLMHASMEDAIAEHAGRMIVKGDEVIA